MTLRGYSDWGLSLTLKELVMWAFFPLFVFTGQNEEGATGVEEGPTTESELSPLCSSGSHTGGAMHVHTCTHIEKRTHRSPGVRSFHREGGGR